MLAEEAYCPLISVMLNLMRPIANRLDRYTKRNLLYPQWLHSLKSKERQWNTLYLIVWIFGLSDSPCPGPAKVRCNLSPASDSDGQSKPVILHHNIVWSRLYLLPVLNLESR